MTMKFEYNNKYMISGICLLDGLCNMIRSSQLIAEGDATVQKGIERSQWNSQLKQWWHKYLLFHPVDRKKSSFKNFEPYYVLY